MLRARTILYLSFCILILGGSVLALSKEYNNLVKYGIIAFIMIWCVLSIAHAKIPRSMFFFVTPIFVSTLVSLAAYLLLNLTDHAIFLSGFFLGLIAVGSAGYTGASQERLGNLTILICAGFFVVLLASLLQPGSLTPHRMQGIFNNPNSFAIFSCTVFVFSSSVLLAKCTSTQFQTALVSVTAISSAVCLVFTQSRTAIIASVGVLVVGWACCAIAGRRSVQRRSGTKFIGVSLAFFMVYAIVYLTGAADSFLDKMGNTIASGDISSGRFESWQIQMRYANLLGYGDSYREILSGRDSAAVVGHSNYFGVLSRFGGIALFVYVITLFFLIGLALYNILKKGEVSFIVPLNLVLLYAVVGVALPQITAPALWLGSFLLFLTLGLHNKTSGTLN